MSILMETNQPWWRSPRGAPWLMAGLVLLSSGAAHVPIWLVLGGGWEGPLAWRKPILFGLSAGATALSLGWALSLTIPRRWDAAWSRLMASALVAEVALITLQTWRGRPSHFNRDTPFDAAIHDAMDVLIALVTLAVLDLTVRTFQSLRVDRAMAAAVRHGLVLLLTSCVIGFVIQAIGWRRQDAGLDPTGFGAAGVLKFPHGMAIHAIQWLPALAWLCQWRGLSATACLACARAASAATWALLLFSLVQTFGGRARFDFTLGSASLFVGSLVLIIVALAIPLIRRPTARPTA